jgi:hypothetical protein
MRDSEFWQRKKISLDRSWKALRRETAGSAPELARLLERIGASARAAGDGELARSARRIGRRFEEVAALETNRELLARARRLGFLSPETAAGLDARWEEHLRERRRRALRKTHRKSKRRLWRALRRRARAGEDRLVRKLERACRRDANRLAPLPPTAGGRQLCRYRAALRSARDLVVAAAEARGLRPPAPLPRETALSDALERWNVLRDFRRRLARERKQAERRGAVTLALALELLISSLDRTVKKARAKALTAARSPANVVSFRHRRAV